MARAELVPDNVHRSAGPSSCPRRARPGRRVHRLANDIQSGIVAARSSSLIGVPQVGDAEVGLFIALLIGHGAPPRASADLLLDGTRPLPFLPRLPTLGTSRNRTSASLHHPPAYLVWLRVEHEHLHGFHYRVRRRERRAEQAQCVRARCLDRSPHARSAHVGQFQQVHSLGLDILGSCAGTGS